MFSTKASRAMTGLTDADFMNVENADAFDYSPDEDGFYETPVDAIETVNESEAVQPSPQLRDVYEKRITTTDATSNKDQDAKLHASKPEPEAKPRPSSSTKNDARPARTNSARRSARKSPLTSTSRESSGGASLLGIISIDDDDMFLRRPERRPSARPDSIIFAARPGPRRSDRLRARNTGTDADVAHLPSL